MDDMTVMTRTIQQERWTLNDLNDIFTWTQIKFKLVKSQSLFIKKARPKKVTFTINGVQIPTVEEKPIKCLTYGRITSEVTRKMLSRWYHKQRSDSRKWTKVSSQVHTRLGAISTGYYRASLGQ